MTMAVMLMAAVQRVAVAFADVMTDAVMTTQWMMTLGMTAVTSDAVLGARAGLMAMLVARWMGRS